jgi:hypothetical protein
MDNREVANRLRAAAEEIRSLRIQVERLAPIADTLRILDRAMNGPPQGQGYGEDQAWACLKLADTLEAEGVKAKTKA